jgi:phospholipase/carboxylesterase
MFEFCENNIDSDTCVVLLHGFGASKEDLLPMQGIFTGAKVISYQAPIDLSQQGYMGGYAWFSLDFTPQGISYDEAEAESVLLDLYKVIDEQRQKFSKLILCGFSQGCILTHALLLRYPGLLDGAIGLSGRYSDFIFADAESKHLVDLPLFISHGSQDDVIPVALGQKIIDFYKNTTVDLQAKIYLMAHDISYECQVDLKNWYQSRFVNS